MNTLTFCWCCFLLIGCLLFGCAQPTDYDAGTFAARTPGELVVNLSQAYSEKDIELYLSTLSEDCLFQQGADTLWGKPREEKIHRNMFASVKNIELNLTEGWNEEATETNRRSGYHYYLQVQLQTERTLEAWGQVELGLVKTASDSWQINSFRELKTSLQKPIGTSNNVNYFPLQVGNQWIYEEQIPFNTNDDVEVLVTDSLTIKGNLYYQAEPFWYLFPISASFARQDSLHQLRLFVEDDSTERIIFNLAAEIGDSLTFIPPFATEEMIVELINHKDSLTVPAGTFKDVLEFLITDNNSGSRFLYEFAANVGLIRQRGSNQEMALKSAYVNGDIITEVQSRLLSWTQIKSSF